MTATTTGTTAGAREHARAQEADAAGTVDTMPTRPATGWPTPPSEVDPATLVHALLRDDGKVLRSDRYVPPDVRGVLAAQAPLL